MASLHHAILTAALTFVVLVSGCAGVVPGTGATSADGQAITVHANTIEAMASLHSYHAVTNMDVSIGTNRTFTNETTVVNRSMAAAAVSRAGSNTTTYRVGDRFYRNTSDGWQVQPAVTANATDPAREQVALLNDSQVLDFRRTRIDDERVYELELAPANETLAGIVADQPGNGIERAESVTVLDRSYEMVVNRTTHRVRHVETTVKFRHRDEIGRATMVTWFTGYDETVPTVPDRASTED